MSPLPTTGAGPSAPAAAAASWWLAGGISAASCVAAYQAKGAASLAASYVNLISPGVGNASVIVAPTWAAETGWTFDGISQALYSPKAQSPMSLVVQFTACTNTGFITGVGASSDVISLQGNGGVGGVLYRNGSSVTAAPTMAAGNLAICLGAACHGYRNGVLDGSPTAATVRSRYIGIGARVGNDTPTGNGFCAVTIVAWALYNIAIDAQVAAVVAAMAAL